MAVLSDLRSFTCSIILYDVVIALNIISHSIQQLLLRTESVTVEAFEKCLDSTHSITISKGSTSHLSYQLMGAGFVLLQLNNLILSNC